MDIVDSDNINRSNVTLLTQSDDLTALPVTSSQEVEVIDGIIADWHKYVIACRDAAVGNGGAA